MYLRALRKLARTHARAHARMHGHTHRLTRSHTHARTYLMARLSHLVMQRACKTTLVKHLNEKLQIRLHLIEHFIRVNEATPSQ